MSIARSRAVDHLGFIGRMLKELTGYATLAFELIQNADDTGNATWMRFDIRDEALWVEDDGGFSDCERQDLSPDDCPFREERRHRCDFHSFRLLSGADKQARENTTGAFGIGFTAVYQVTDRPEIISGRRHWVIDETAAEDGRIAEDPVKPPHGETRIILPWARNPNSLFRRKASAAVVVGDVEDELYKALDEALAPAMLFLRNLRRIEIARRGRVVRVVTREVQGDEVVVGDGGEAQRWRLLRGDFREEADRLRTRHGDSIELARKPYVSVAIPVGFEVEGRLCATLPTGQPTGLPVHVNAEFYLASDRRKLEMGAREHRAWNAAAIDCAAKLVAGALGELPDLLGPEPLWAALGAARELEQKKHPDTVTEALAAFWRRFLPEIPHRELVWTSDKRWATVERARLVQPPEDEVAFPILQEIGIALVHPTLRARQNILRAVGVRLLSLRDVAAALRDVGLDTSMPIAQLPQPLDDTAVLKQLWLQLGRMIGRLRGKDARDAAIRELEVAAIVPSTKGELCPTHALWRTDPQSAELMSAASPPFPLLDQGLLPEDAAPLAELCDALTASGAINQLGGEELLQVDVNLARELVGWFAHREHELHARDRKILSQLAIFPSADEVHPLGGVALPGDFEDQLGLASLVERETSREYGSFLTRLGIRRLSFDVYASEHIPRVFEEGNLPTERRRAVVSLLAKRKGQLDDVSRARSALAAVPLAECSDGDWRLARDVYFDRQSVMEVLGPQPPRAKLPAEHKRAVEELLAWLGVAHEPRAVDVVRRVGQLARQEVHDSRKSVEHVVDWIGQRWEKLDVGGREAYLPLRDLQWLPARGNGAWHLPGDLDFTFRDYLYESQGRFVDLGRPVQNRAVDFLRWLGLSDNPSIIQVVAHLRHCASEDNQPNRQVYDFLNSHPDAPPIAKLRDVACLRVDDGRWCRPTEVYWSDHPFGRWRLRLGSEFARYRALFDALGVKEKPGYEDAMRVIRDVSEEYLPFNRKVSDEDRSVLFNCWRLCEEALSSSDLGYEELKSFGKQKVIANSRGLLTEARHLFFEDIPGLADELPGIRDHVIQRPDGAWRAMHAAGVRDLSKVAVAHIVDRGGRIAGEALRQRGSEREEELARVIAPRTLLSWRQVAEPLHELNLIEVTSPTVAWELEAFGRRFPGEPRPADALWQEKEGALYVAVVDDVPVWEAVARELVRALLPQIEPATLALDIAAALSPPTTGAAKRALDAASFPPLAAEIRAQILTPTANDLDADDTEQTDLAGQGWSGSDDDYEAKDEHETGHDLRRGFEENATQEDDTEEALAETPGRSDDAEDKTEQDDDTRGLGITGEHKRSGSSRVEEAAGRKDDGRNETRGGTTAPPSEGRAPSTSRSRGHLRSYVVRGDADGVDRSSGDGQRNAVDQAGVGAVVRFEKGAGRRPKVEPHNNPGYDVLSLDQGGEVARYIEIKFSEGPWDEAGVGLSSRQFEQAQQGGERYWLYVVEYALDEQRRAIWRVPNPARQVTDFMFDSGWKDAVELNEAEDVVGRRDIRFKGGVRL